MTAFLLYIFKTTYMLTFPENHYFLRFLVKPSPD